VTTTPAALPRFEIFAPGRHTAMNGDTLSFAAGDLSQTATAYDPALMQAPLCVGHPKHDLPAYGWVRSLSVDNGRLVAETEQVDAAFAAAIEAGRFKARSAAFFHPDAPNNPVPGTWYLRHVAFLGAAVPAVAGLKPIAFSADDDGVVAFGAVEPGRLAWSLRGIATVFRGFREYLIERDGAEKADAVIPAWRVDDLIGDAARLEEDSPAFATPVPAPEEDPMTKTPDAAELARREADLAQREAAFAADLARRQAADNAAFVDELVKDARLPAGLKDETLAFMAALPVAGDTVAFAAADGTAVKKTPSQAFRDLLGKLPQTVDFGERAPADRKDVPAAAFAAPSGYSVDPDRLAIHLKALDHQSKNPGTDYTTAVRAVGGV
jgi:hypothetical protein